MADPRIDDAVDVVEGEVGSSRLREPSHVEAAGRDPEIATLPGVPGDRQDLPDDEGRGDDGLSSAGQGPVSRSMSTG